MSDPHTPNPERPGAASLGGPPAALVGALRKLLRPLVKLMLSQGITYPYVSDLLKGLFVEVADQDFRLENKPPTDSRVSLVSGVHRKDVSRLRSGPGEKAQATSSVVPLSAQLVAQWLGNPRYCLENGQPRPLPRLISEGGDLSFEALVTSVNSDIRSRVVLDEWLHQGMALMDEAGKVCLNTQAFVPSEDAQEKAFYLGHNLHDHAAAAVHNVLGGQPAFMERSVHYSGLTPDAVQKLDALSRELGMQTLLAVNKAAMEAQAAALPTPTKQAQVTPNQRFTLGVYFYATPLEAQGVDHPKTPEGTE
ncbi:MAG: DUF6502 family protein [Hydrogenophaga sp.]